MVLLRLILIIVLAWLAFSWVRRLLLTRRDTRPATAKAPTKTVKCAVCGVYVPIDKAIGQGDATYCSEAHQQAHSDD